MSYLLLCRARACVLCLCLCLCLCACVHIICCFVASALRVPQVESARKARLRPFDQALKRFRYGEALDAALASCEPAVVASVLEELSIRQV